MEAAIRNARMYAAIGLTEEIDVTIELFERKLAPFFAGATAVVGSAKWNGAKRSTKQLNPLTNTTLNGALPDKTRGVLEKHATNYHAEMAFYNAMKRTFWEQVSRVSCENENSYR